MISETLHTVSQGRAPDPAGPTSKGVGRCGLQEDEKKKGRGMWVYGSCVGVCMWACVFVGVCARVCICGVCVWMCVCGCVCVGVRAYAVPGVGWRDSYWTWKRILGRRLVVHPSSSWAGSNEHLSILS